VADPLHVDTDKINLALPGVQHVENSLQAVWSDLADTLDSLGACWGGDETGQRFAEQYLAPTKEMFAGMRDTTTALGSMRDGIVTMSNGFHQTETSAIETASALKPSAGPTRKP